MSGGFAAPSETEYVKKKFLNAFLKIWAQSDSGKAELEANPLEEPTHAGVAVQASDTGRILMIQRSLDPTDAPDVQGTWEFPGGTIEDGETPEVAAWREFCEETGLPQPTGEQTGGWVSPDGIYQCFIFTVPVEAEAFSALNPDAEAAHVDNPDDPGRRTPDVSAWFTVEQIKGLGVALRPEVAKTDWSLFGAPSEGDAAMPKDETPPEGTYAAQVSAWAANKKPMDPEPAPQPQTPQDEADVEGDLIDPSKADVPPTEPVNDAGGAPAPSPDQAVPFHTVFAVEGRKTGDRRRFLPGSLTNRPLPLPFAYQKVNKPEHDDSVVVGRIEKMKHKVPITLPSGEAAVATVGAGHMLNSPESDDFIGFAAQYGRFGISLDGDSAVGEVNEADECVDYSMTRIAGGTAVPIPALYEAWVELGEAPPEWGLDEPDEAVDPETAELPDSLVASFNLNDVAMTMVFKQLVGEQAFKDLAPGKTEDGPGWLTHPVDTERLRHYWVHGEGAAEIGWGTPGDFNRCRVAVGKYIEPQYLAGYCANRHYDALGFWPGRPVAGDTVKWAHQSLELTEEPKASSFVLTASAADEVLMAPAAWFSETVVDDDPRLVDQGDGHFAVPWTVTAEGQCYGHVAYWGQCHIGKQFEGICMEPPHSETDYSAFLSKATLLDDGSQVATGVISIGGGHAGERLSVRRALAHYDSTSTAACDVTITEDAYGIWAAGWVRPGIKPEMVAAVRGSNVSGDWRQIGVHPLEMVAVLAVNVGGFQTRRPRIAASGRRGQLSLVSANMVKRSPEQEAERIMETPEFTQDFAAQVAMALDGIQRRRAEMATLAARYEKESA